MTSSLAEVVLGGVDTSWLDQSACDGMDPEDFFVNAGHTIKPEVIAVCRGCPVRVNCLMHAYDSVPAMLNSGYFGGVSPGQRRKMSRAEALAWVEADIEAFQREQATGR